MASLIYYISFFAGAFVASFLISRLTNIIVKKLIGARNYVWGDVLGYIVVILLGSFGFSEELSDFFIVMPVVALNYFLPFVAVFALDWYRAKHPKPQKESKA